MHVDGLLRAALLLLIAALPWCFGGVAPLYRLIAASVLAVCLLVVLGRRQTTAAWGAIWVTLAILVAAIVLGAAQLSPPVAELAQHWNLESVEIRRDFSASPTTDSKPPGAPLSLHSPSTRRDLAALCSAVAAFVLGAALFAETRPLIILMSTTAVIGGAVAFFGLVQRLTWNGLIYWSESIYGGQPFGPFINRNNAGGFLELTLAAAVGLLLWKLLSIPSLDETANRRRRPIRSSPSRRLTWLLANLNATILSAVAAVLVISAGILASLSRGSFLAMTVGSVGALLLITLASRRTAFAWVLGVVVASGLGLTAWLGQNDALYERLATLSQPASLQQESRIAHWQTSLEAARDFWLFGSGLGTYRYAYTRYQQAPTSVTYLYAENQYLDALVSGGVVGLVLMLSALAAFGFTVLRLLRYARTSADYGIAATAAVLLTTQVLHACFDFALYVPAHFLLFSLFCGALSRRAAACRDGLSADDAIAHPARGARFTATAFGLVLLASLGLGMNELRSADVGRRAESVTRISKVAAPSRDAAWIEQALETQRRAVADCPDDGELRTRLAELWIERYRIKFQQEIGNLPVHPARLLWGRPEQLYANAHLLARTLNETALENLRSSPLVAENLRPALVEARRARELCPLSPYPQMLVAKLCFLDESPLNDIFYLDRVERLVNGREQWLYELGALHLDAARTERAFALWRRCLEMSTAHRSQIIHFASGFLTPEQLMAKLFPESPHLIVYVARTYFTADDQQWDRNLFLNRAVELLSSADRPPAPDCRLLGSIHAELGRFAEATTWYERALAFDGTQADWYVEAATAHAALGNWAKAADYASKSVRLRPGNTKSQELLDRIAREIDKTGTTDILKN